MSNVKIGDVNMYYKIHGEGEPLVLITGLSSDHKIYYYVECSVIPHQYQLTQKLL
jgi:hypothetical protein